jgi:GT2 family glycosyltransferase
MAYRSSVFKQGAKFDETLVGYALGEDMLFSHKLHLVGKQLCRINTALIEHRCSEENRSDDLKMFIMTLAYRRYIINNITKNKILSKLYYWWFCTMLVLSISILCMIGKRNRECLSDCLLARTYVSNELDILKINKFVRGEE